MTFLGRDGEFTAVEEMILVSKFARDGEFTAVEDMIFVSKSKLLPSENERIALDFDPKETPEQPFAFLGDNFFSTVTKSEYLISVSCV
jgi:hypothetical protein